MRLGRLPMRPVLLAAVMLFFFVPPARAADDADKPFEEPGIAYLKRTDPYIQWIVGSAFIGACVLVAFKNPHRSHLD